MTSTPGIDFSRITLCDALDLALFVEEEARDRYEEFAEQLAVHHTPEAADFFRKMSRIEEKHRMQLQTRRQALFGNKPPAVRRTMIFDIEAPEYDEARAYMTVRHALEVALRCEVKAHGFFVAAVSAVRDPEIRALFEELREDEIKHQELVLAEMRRAIEQPGNPDDYSDEAFPQ
jgi:rubrerythrin